jgi:hypothetical protein
MESASEWSQSGRDITVCLGSLASAFHLPPITEHQGRYDPETYLLLGRCEGFSVG